MTDDEDLLTRSPNGSVLACVAIRGYDCEKQRTGERPPACLQAVQAVAKRDGRPAEKMMVLLAVSDDAVFAVPQRP